MNNYIIGQHFVKASRVPRLLTEDELFLGTPHVNKYDAFFAKHIQHAGPSITRPTSYITRKNKDLMYGYLSIHNNQEQMKDRLIPLVEFTFPSPLVSSDPVGEEGYIPKGIADMDKSDLGILRYFAKWYEDTDFYC